MRGDIRGNDVVSMYSLCDLSPVCATISFLCTVNNMHCVTIKSVDNQIYIFVPTFFVLKFCTNSCLLKWKKIGSGGKQR